jgi:hypothetical protein
MHYHLQKSYFNRINLQRSNETHLPVIQTCVVVIMRNFYGHIKIH